MTPTEAERLAAVEEHLADVFRQLRATRAHLSVLRALLADNVAETEDDGENAAVVDVSSVRATAQADQVAPWGRHSQRAGGPARRGLARDRHGLHAL
ncbi:hypothetical protein [Streptomyces sp. NPDC048392]|uniref:hypothetical protein n=1 Tax=Streptomyces sp. NPDC048392 TaxID=3365543 RepID=UPI003722A5C1